MRIDTLPRVENSQVRLRQIHLSDIDSWYAYLSKPHVVEHTSWALQSSNDLRSLIEAYNSIEETTTIRFAIVRSSDNLFVGTIGFHTISPINRTAEIAFDLAPEHWCKNIATECCRIVVEWGFRHQRYVRVQATALTSNAPSMRVLQKCGFLLEGKLRNFRMVRGEPRDFWLYARTPDDPL